MGPPDSVLITQFVSANDFRNGQAKRLGGRQIFDRLELSAAPHKTIERFKTYWFARSAAAVTVYFE